MKVVLDTNVFISAIFWKGPPRQILKYAEEGMHSLTSIGASIYFPAQMITQQGVS